MASVQIASMAAALGVAASMWLAAPAVACDRSDFEAVVEDAAAALRTLNSTNKPLLQGKLGQLKHKRAWTHDQFLEKAAPLVQDTTIADFDARSSRLLDDIQNGGAEGATARAPDCALLSELRAALKVLIGVQKDKWSYMLSKIDEELAR
jgi:hypothetical protein